MNYPEFFDQVPGIRMYDPLAEFLGAAERGILEYRYADAVRLAGHSCPTVAAAYWMTCKALRALYPDGLPQRGNIRVEFAEAQADGVTGVIANIASLVTGAAGDGGFKGIGGDFDRRGKLLFEADVQGEIRFTRLDSGCAAEAAVDLQSQPAPPRLRELLAMCRNGSASDDERREFRHLWQHRVRSLLLEHGEDERIFRITRRLSAGGAQRS